MTFYKCATCGAGMLNTVVACFWCGGPAVTEVPEAAPIEPRPALPAECWNGDVVDAEVAMAAVRSLCGG